MSERIHPPAVNPCGSCPYRKDVPSGVWSEEEYAKLPLYDRELAFQPPSVFMCHQQNDKLCSGWTGCHDMGQSLGFRIAVIAQRIVGEDVDAVLDYTTPVPLFTSGEEAAAHGRVEIEHPGERAGKIVDKLTKKQGVRR